MKRIMIAVLALTAVLMTGCSAKEPAAPTTAPVSVPKAPEPAPTPTAPEPAPSPAPERPPAISLEEAYRLVSGVNEVIQERRMLRDRFVLMRMGDEHDPEFWHISVGEDTEYKVRFFIHLKVHKQTGAVWLAYYGDAERRVEPILVTGRSALATVLERPDVKLYQNQVGAAFAHDVSVANDDYFRVLLGELKGEAPVWTRRYLVHRGGGWVLAEEVWPPAEPVSAPVSRERALALVEALEPAQKLKVRLGDGYTTDVVEDPGDGSWRVMLGTYREGLGFNWQDDYNVDPKTGAVSHTTVLEY